MLLGALVPGQDAASRVQEKDAVVLAAFDHQAEELVFFLERLLGRVVLRNVADESEYGRLALVLKSVAGDADGHDRAVFSLVASDADLLEPFDLHVHRFQKAGTIGRGP